jgi:type IV pilus assembly protein PilW
MIDDPNDPGFANAFAGVRGYERGADAAWAAVPDPNELSGDILVGEDAGGARHGSDVLSLRLTESLNPDDPNDPLLSALVLPSSTAVSVDDNPDCEIEQNDRLVLTGCNLTAHLFEVSNAQVCSPATPPNPTTFAFGAPNVTTQINTTYNLDSQLLRYEEVVWFVADTGRDIRVDGQTYDIQALFREVNGVRQEMVEGVEFMQVRFGQRVAGTTNLRFADPSDPDLNSGLNYEGVNSVRVALLVQSFEPVRDTADTRTYSLLGEDFSTTTAAAHGGLRFQREVFTATISLRNAPEF